ncbi:hypothetical protein BOX37_08080 [Nocardia mangyaensis]|uniref:Uncharacterized protein n=1 Tax=Nocardia mangyaensis TaxID=2213200 RepID=A0A1J0VPH0_9NOCA|nr:hypothetical protein [Nocardia mangyaensis]APE33933.1 hypothetical protein BOX37_08080 [Nocardia mangyaensis]
MYIEEFTAAGPLTEHAVDELTLLATRYTSTITLTVATRTVQLPVLSTCWTELPITTGTPITVEAAHGYCPADREDSTALRDFVTTFQRATAPTESR